MALTAVVQAIFDIEVNDSDSNDSISDSNDGDSDDSDSKIQIRRQTLIPKNSEVLISLNII